ncbi:hypothetical protein AAG906_019756 [Vitis piasezkii]
MGLLLQPSITLHHGLQEYRALSKWGMHKLSSLQNFITVTEKGLLPGTLSMLKIKKFPILKPVVRRVGGDIFVAEQMALAAVTNWHFLFNSLASVPRKHDQDIPHPLPAIRYSSYGLLEMKAMISLPFFSKVSLAHSQCAAPVFIAPILSSFSDKDWKIKMSESIEVAKALLHTLERDLFLKVHDAGQP